MPAKYIYEPWKASLKVQEEAGCIIGKDYPAPIVDHTEASKRCIQRIKAAYDAGKESAVASPSSSSKRPAQGSSVAKAQPKKAKK